VVQYRYIFWHGRQPTNSFLNQQTEEKMKKILAILVSMLMIAVLLSTALTAQASAGVPFKGTLKAVETQTIEFPYMYVDGQGSGNATHLGRFAHSYQGKVYIPELAGDITATFTAANGDKIYSQGTGQGAPSAVPGYVVIKMNVTITGGTGRFAGATGSYYLERLVNTDTKESTGWFEGTIFLP
jgi:hypothetical protein